MGIEKLIEQGEKTHGSFAQTSALSQQLKACIRMHGGSLSYEQSEALVMICVKIARIVAGSANERDHWDDIAGYATLVSKSINE